MYLWLLNQKLLVYGCDNIVSTELHNEPEQSQMVKLFCPYPRFQICGGVAPPHKRKCVVWHGWYIYHMKWVKRTISNHSPPTAYFVLPSICLEHDIYSELFKCESKCIKTEEENVSLLRPPHLQIIVPYIYFVPPPLQIDLYSSSVKLMKCQTVLIFNFVISNINRNAWTNLYYSNTEEKSLNG